VQDFVVAMRSARTASAALIAVVVLIENSAYTSDTGSVARLRGVRISVRLFLHIQGIVCPFFSMHM